MINKLQNYQLVKNGYGQKILIDPTDFIGRKIKRYGFYDRMGLYYLEKILARLSEPIVLDVGSNIGNHALIMALHSKKVYLFEPQAFIVNILEQIKNLNQITNWQIFNFGLSNVEQSLPLYQNSDGNNGKSTLVPTLKSDHYFLESVMVYKGDEVIKNQQIPRVDFIKIDVEGSEAEVILGMQQSIKKFSPILMVEWNNDYTKQKFMQYDLFNQVLDNYVVKALIDRGHYSSWYKKQFKWRQFFSKQKLKKENWLIDDFNRDNDYEHILFIPKNKSEILAGL